VAVGADAPDVKGLELAVAGEGGDGGGEVAALGAQDFDHGAITLDDAAVGLDGDLRVSSRR